MSRIWVPKFKIIEPKAAIAVPARMRGRFKLQVRKAHHGTIRHETPWTDNLILDNGLDIINNTPNQFWTVAVGSGNSTPANSQSALDSLVASTTDHNDSAAFTRFGSPDFKLTKRWTFQFGQGDAEGNLAEVGIGPGEANLFSRALIVDGAGDPTTLTIQSDEFLDVTYEITLFIPQGDVTGTIDISGTSHDYTMRAAGAPDDWAVGEGGSDPDRDVFMRAGFTNGEFEQIAEAYDGAINASITGSPSGSVEDATSRSQADSYSSGDFERDCQAQWDLGAGNFATGIQSAKLVFGAWGDSCRNPFQIEYDPVIDKGDTEVLTLQFRHSWGRAEASS